MERSASASSSVGPIRNGDGASVTLCGVGESVACTTVSPPVPLRAAGEPTISSSWGWGALPRDVVVRLASPGALEIPAAGAVCRIPAAGAERIPADPGVVFVFPREVEWFCPLSPFPALWFDGRPQGQQREHPPQHPSRVQSPAKHSLVHPHQQHEVFRPRRCPEGLPSVLPPVARLEDWDSRSRLASNRMFLSSS